MSSSASFEQCIYQTTRLQNTLLSDRKYITAKMPIALPLKLNATSSDGLIRDE